MLENIKSKFIYQNIFSYINEKTKLNIVKYNKILQSQINLGLINYMVISERYIIFGNNGTGKQYGGYTCGLKFEGEF